jgi:hypothetical protein
MGSANGEYPIWRADWSWDELVGGWWGSKPLNAQTRRDSFPMPLIDDVLDQLG